MHKHISVHNPVFPWILHPTHLYQFALDNNLQPEDVLEKTGLRATDTESAELSISWVQYKQISDNISKAGFQDWPIHFGNRLDVTSHGLISLLALNCFSWDQLFELLELYPILVSPVFYVERKETPEFVYFGVHPEFLRDASIDDSLVVFFIMLANSLKKITGIKNIPCNYIKLYAKQERPSYANNLGIDDVNIVWSSQLNQVKIDKSFFHFPLPFSNPKSAFSNRKAIQAQLKGLKVNRGGLRSLRALFKKEIYQMEACASELHTSVTTLKRYLTSYASGELTYNSLLNPAMMVSTYY